MVSRADSFELQADVEGAESAAESDSTEGLYADIAEGGLTRAQAKRRLDEWYPNGPSNLDEVLGWKDTVKQGLNWYDLASGSSFSAELTRVAEEEVVVMTSSYSGVGTAEYAGAALLDAARQDTTKGGKFIVYSVTENWHVAQDVLAAHSASSKALHRFMDILGRLPSKVREACAAAQERKLGEAADLEDRRKSRNNKC